MRRFPTFSGPFSSGVRVGLPLISPRVFTRRSPFMSSIDPYPTMRSYALRAPLESTFPYTASAPVMGPVSLGIPGYTSGFAPYTTSAPRLTGPIAAGVSRYTPGVGAFSPISRLTTTLGGVSSLGPALSIGVSSSLGSGTSVGSLLSASGLPTSIGSTPRISPLISASGLGTSIGSTPSISPLISVSSLPVSPAVSAGSAGLETSYLIDTGSAPIRTSGVTLEPVGIIDESGRYRAFDRSAVGTTGLSVALSGGRMASGGSPLNRNSELALGTTSFGLGTQRPVVSGIDSMGIGVDGGAGIRYSEIGDASGFGSVNRLNNLNTLNRDASLGGSFSTGPSSIVTTGTASGMPLISTAGSVASSSPFNYNARNTIGDQNLPTAGASSFNAGGVDFRSPNSGGITGDIFRTGGIATDSRNIGFANSGRNIGGIATDSRNIGGFAADSRNIGTIAADSRNIGGFAVDSRNTGGFANSGRNTAGFATDSRVAVGNLNSGRDFGNINAQRFDAGNLNSQGFAASGLNSQGFAADGLSSQGFAAGGLNSGGGGAVSLNSRQAAIGGLNTGSSFVPGRVDVVGLNSLNRAGSGDVRVQDSSFAGSTNAGRFGGNLRDTSFMNGVGTDTSGLASNLRIGIDQAGSVRTGSLGSTDIRSSDPTYVTNVNTIRPVSGAGREIGGSVSVSGLQSVGPGLLDQGGAAGQDRAGGISLDVSVAGGTGLTGALVTDAGAGIGPGFNLGPGGFAGKSRNSGPLLQPLGTEVAKRPNIINDRLPGRSV